jgi:hypothetical protein
MPNWVYNSVSISGDVEVINALREQLSAPYEIRGEVVSSPFSFWNVVKPTNLEKYNGVVGTGGLSMNDPEGWYGWNCANWGCKWDASFDDKSDGYELVGESGASLQYHFDTAWSQPQPIIDWLAEYCRKNKLEMSWYYEEEQGWGGEVLMEEGERWEREWDIPNSHEEYLNVNRDCICEWEEDEEIWFDDCPRKEVK